MGTWPQMQATTSGPLPQSGRIHIYFASTTTRRKATFIVSEFEFPFEPPQSFNPHSRTIDRRLGKELVSPTDLLTDHTVLTTHSDPAQHDNTTGALPPLLAVRRVLPLRHLRRPPHWDPPVIFLSRQYHHPHHHEHLVIRAWRRRIAERRTGEEEIT